MIAQGRDGATEHGRHGHLDEVDGRVLCHECGRSFRSLIGHITRKHGLTADEYREAHGLARTRPLMAADVREALHVSGIRRRDGDPRVLAALQGPAATEQRASAFPRSSESRRPGTRHATAEAKAAAGERALQVKLAVHGWNSLAEAVAWAKHEQLGWSALATRLGVSHTPLARRGRREGLDLPPVYAHSDTTAAMLAAALRQVAEHGTLRGAGGALGHWLAVRRNLGREGPIEAALDDIDLTWRTTRPRRQRPPVDVLLDLARTHVAEHGSLRGARGDLSRWLATTRHAAARTATPSLLHQTLDALDPRWREPAAASSPRKD